MAVTIYRISAADAYRVSPPPSAYASAPPARTQDETTAPAEESGSQDPAAGLRGRVAEQAATFERAVTYGSGSGSAVLADRRGVSSEEETVRRLEAERDRLRRDLDQAEASLRMQRGRTFLLSTGRAASKAPGGFGREIGLNLLA